MPLASFPRHSSFLDSNSLDQASTASGQAESARPSTSLGRFSRQDERSSMSQITPAFAGQRSSSERRFNMLRFRNASDPQLSTRFKDAEPKQETPSTPPTPEAAPAPVIGFTSPKRDSYERSSGGVKQFWSRQQSFRSRSSSTARPSEPNSALSKGRKSIAGRLTSEQSPRLSTTNFDGAPPPYGEHAKLPLAPVGPRMSGSSTSEEPWTYAATTTTQTTVSTTTTFFKIPRKKNKKQESLFPLPPRPLPSKALLLNTSQASSGTSPVKSPMDSPLANSPTPSSKLRPTIQSHSTNEIPLLRTSATNAALAAFSPALTGPGLSTLRNNSTMSAPCSPLTAPSLEQRLRERSETFGSSHIRSDDEAPRTLPGPYSGRNSMTSSTLGRNSIGGLRSLTSRFRHPSETSSPRYGSPGPLASSQHDSFAISRETLVMPAREEGETAGRFYSRLESDLPKKSIAALLAKSSDPFNHDVLRSLMRTFKFYEVPLDISIRKFLWEIDLPAEAQQIDRVISAFAERYHECNPHIFHDFDQVYLVAYSLIILHSDLFNKNNKRKMQKSEYQKNTGGHGIDEEILGYFYDNIQYTEFIAQDPNEDDLEGKAKAKLRKGKRNPSRVGLYDASKNSKTDPYDFIIDPDTELDRLGPSLKNVFNLDDTYSYYGTAEGLDIPRLREAFLNFGTLQIISARSRPGAFATDALINNPLEASQGLVAIEVAKVGIIQRKNSKRRKTERPWQYWGAVLTSSRLYFFRNTGWVRTLATQFEAHRNRLGENPLIYKPPLEEFKPDLSIELNGTISLLDKSYEKHKNAFVLARNDQWDDETILAENDAEMNDWIAKINFAATFTTTCIQMEKKDDKPSDKTARAEAISKKIPVADSTIPVAKQKLEERLRNARHLLMLAPFPSKTRSELLAYGARIAHRIKWSRYEVWQLQCHLDVLSKYLDPYALKRPIGPPANVDSQILNFAKVISPRTSSRPNALSRLNSKASALMSPQKIKSGKNQLSNSPSISRSKEVEKGDEALPAPSLGSGSVPGTDSRYVLPLLGLGSGTLSVASKNSTDRATDRPISSGAESTATDGILRQASLASALSHNEGSIHEAGAVGVVIPAATVQSIDKDNVLGQMPSAAAESVESDMEQVPTLGTPDNRTKARRSLQRTLRDSRELQNSNPHRSRKGKESISSSNADESLAPAETEGIPRGAGSFTLHGKKASVITLGSEWQNMSAEDRLKMRKQAQGDDTKPSAPNMTGSDTGRSPSASLKADSAKKNSHRILLRDLSPFGSDAVHLDYQLPEYPFPVIDDGSATATDDNVRAEQFSTSTASRIYNGMQSGEKGAKSRDHNQEKGNGRPLSTMRTFFKDSNSDDGRDADGGVQGGVP